MTIQQKQLMEVRIVDNTLTRDTFVLPCLIENKEHAKYPGKSGYLIYYATGNQFVVGVKIQQDRILYAYSLYA